MAGPLPRRTRWLAAFVVVVTLLLGLATGVFWEDLRRTALDPKVPFQTYDPPPAPDYRRPDAWWLIPARSPARGDPPADVFFIGPTVYDGGEHWNAPLDHPDAEAMFRRRMAPNYAGPFLRLGRIFAPRYRQASLYSLLTLREDAREARRFAYGDVAQAFRTYVTRHNRGRPFIIVGVEQGGTLAARLLMEEVALDPALRGRLVAAYLQETVVRADVTPLPACQGPGQTGCLAAWASVLADQNDRARLLLDRALVWAPGGELENLGGRPALCFNPILGAANGEPAPARLHRGAANATDLEWGARPAFMARQVSAQCEGGVLRVSVPRSAALKRSGSWADRRKAPGYNLFYADLEADAEGRLDAWRPPLASPP
ncbi:DUF3089 domain-containing protein [Phenylobacterium sp.]|jgi:hypothetical protein|uniref:DUF3089 domain-containing protein n=1 Tax=Phenylobacterium sp. TaxID=1871053 RepID=UPI002F951F2A